MPLKIRKAKEEDASIVVEFLWALYKELGEEAHSTNFLTEKLILEMFRSGRTEIFFALRAEEIIGLMTLTESQAIYAGGKFGVIDEMFVKKEFRKCAVGKKLIEKALETAREKNWKRIDVTAPTEEKWKRTVKFYEQNGFIFTGPKLKIIINDANKMS